MLERLGRAKWREILFLCLLAAPLLILFRPVFLKGYTLEGIVDRREFTLPVHYLNCRAFASGEYPQWNPYVFNGVPQSVVGMDYAWSPFNWPLYLFGHEKDIPKYFSWVQILKQLFTGIFAFLFFRRVIRSLACAALAAVAYAWSAPVVWNMITSEFYVFMFLPLGMLLLHEAAGRFRLWHVALFGLVMAIDIGGGVLQWSFYLWLLWGAYALYLAVVGGKIRLFRLPLPNSLALFACGSALAFLLSAPKMVPFVMDLISGEAMRGQGLSIAKSVEYSRTPLLAYLRLVSSNMLGYVSYEYWDKYPLLGCPGVAQNYAETMLAHAGFIPLVLALFCALYRKARRQALFPLVVAAVILLVLPGTPLTYVVVAITGTGLKYGRFALFLPFFLAWAAGIGLSEFRPDLLRNNRRLKIGMLVLAVAMLLGLIEVFRLILTIQGDVRRYYMRCAGISGIILAAVTVIGLVLWQLHRKGSLGTTGFQTGLLLATLGELFAGAATSSRLYQRNITSPPMAKLHRSTPNKVTTG